MSISSPVDDIRSWAGLCASRIFPPFICRPPIPLRLTHNLTARWVSYRGPSGRHAPALPLHCCHGRSNVGARHRLQGRDAPGVVQATGACSPCQAGADSPHGLVPRLGGGTPREKRGQGGGVHKNMRLVMARAREGCLPKRPTGPSLLRILHAARVPSGLLVCSAHSNARCANDHGRSQACTPLMWRMSDPASPPVERRVQRS